MSFGVFYISFRRKLISSRHIAEKGNFRVAQGMFSSSLRICEAYAMDMPELYADALFCSGSYASDTNQFKLHLKLAHKHFDQRMSVENQKPKLGLGAGMAYSEWAWHIFSTTCTKSR